MGSREDRERLAPGVEIGELRVGAGEMTLEVKLVVAARQEERDLARDQPLCTVADEQAELMALDVFDQELGAGFGEGWR